MGQERATARRRGRTYTVHEFLAGLEDMKTAGVLTFGFQPGEDAFLVRFSGEFVKPYGSRERLAGLLEMRLVLMRVWKP